MNIERNRRPTSFDVAERAGVSQSTVSRALSGSPVIAEPTRSRVMKAAEELGYFVDERAARLRRGSTGTLAVVVICRPGETAGEINPFAYALLGSVCLAASERGFETLVSFQAHGNAFFGHYQEHGRADGLVVIGTTTNEAAWDYFRKLKGEGRRVVYWGSPTDDLEWVRSDNHAAGKLAAEHLLAAGYCRPCFMGALDGPQRQFAERYEGYAAVMREAGLEPVLIVPPKSPTRAQEGRRAARRLIARPDGIDAVFAACDAMALGALEAFAAADLLVPRDMGVIGFDDLLAARLSRPSLTSIGPDPAEAGAALVETVLAQDEGASQHGGQHAGQHAGQIGGQIGGQGEGIRHLRVPVTLMPRASTAKG